MELPLYGIRVSDASGDHRCGMTSMTIGDAPHVLNLAAVQPLKNASGSGCPALAASNTILFGEENNIFQQGKRSKKQGVNASRVGPVSVPDEGRIVSGEDGSDVSTASSSTYMRHHRYEDPFTAYQMVSDPYDRHREIERQERFISDSKRIGRPFIPSGGRALEKPTRYLLGDCVAALYRTAARDWPETDPIVISTSEDLVVVYFKRDRVRNTSTLMRYMNASLKRSEAVRTFDLRKVAEGWDVITDDGHIMYTFRPPWVRQQRFLPDQVVVRKAH